MSDTPAYLLRWRGRQSGPFTPKEINRKLDDHEIGMGHEIQCQDRWISVSEFLRLQVPAATVTPAESPAASLPPPIARTPGGAVFVPPPPAPAPVVRANSSPCRRLIFATLAILLGFLGVHNFYARHWLTGVIQLLVSIASLLLGFGVIAPWLWAMTEAILVRKDGYEQEMT